MPYLDAVSVLSDDESELTIFAVNRSMDESLKLECDIRSFPGFKIIEAITLTNDDKKAVNTKSNPENVVPRKFTNYESSDNRITAELPKMSWNVIRLKKTDRE